MERKSHSAPICDYDDISDRFGISLTQGFESRNIYSPLADMIRDSSAEIWERCQYEVLREKSNNLEVISSSILAYEHAIKPTKAKLRLNSTTPGNPESAEILEIEKPKTEKREASFGDGEGNGHAAQDGSVVTKAERMTFVLKRVCDKFSRCTHKDFAVLQWLILSSATPAWKARVFDTMYEEGSMPFGAAVLMRSTVLAMVVASAMKYRCITTAQEQELSVTLYKAFVSGKFDELSLEGFHCLSEDCNAWLSGYQLYKQTDSAAHQKYLTAVSAIRQIKTDEHAR